VSGLPVLLIGNALEALVVGGGAVAERKVRTLVAAGARVRVVAERPTAAMRALARAEPAVALVERPYLADDVRDAALVVAATDRREVNARVAANARELRRLVVVADTPLEGNCTMMALHRADGLVVAVSAAGVPGAAARIRDAIARRFDGRYGDALRALVALRGHLLANRAVATWRRAGRELVGADFCEAVESGRFPERVASWR
jgi:siroheme synthase-like protein